MTEVPLIKPPVLLIIKAANLKNVDYKVECELYWSVRQLKVYLSENYPTKPNIKYMRLIYFGKLLDDHLELKDFLRLNNEINHHNIHIVYKQTEQIDTPQQVPQQNPIVYEENTNRENAANMSQKERARAQYEEIYTRLKEYYERNGLSVTNNAWNSSFLQHTALYYHMYSNYIQSLGINTNINESTNSGSDILNTTFVIPEPVQPQQQAAPVPPAQQPQFQNDLNDNRNEEREDDWLSLLHNFCSFLVLFSIIYFYSSFTRFMLVFGVVILIVLYQTGWFTLERRQVRNENQPNNNNPAPQEPNQNGENEAQPEAAVPPQVPARPQYSIIRLLFTFVITFFTSLLPERAARVPN